MAEYTLLDVARIEAERYLSGQPTLYRFRDDIVSDACLGAVQAIAKHDPAAGASLNTYAGRRARGAILDGVRYRAPVPRWKFAHGVTLADLPPQYQPPESVEGRADLGWDPAEVGSLEDEVANGDLVERMLATCTERERIVLKASIIHGYTYADIAAVLGITESGARQIKRRAIVRLCRQFANSWEDAA